MTECEEVAANIKPGWVGTFGEALVLARQDMPDESHAVVGEVAWKLYLRSRREQSAA